MTTRHTAIIPVVERGSDKGILLEIYAEQHLPNKADQQDSKDGIQPIVSELARINLLSQGHNALAGVNTLLDAVGKHYLNLQSRKIWPKEEYQSANIEDRSAELGIALAVLMNACHCKTRVILATGAVLSDTEGVKIGKIGRLPDKILAIIKNQQTTKNSIFFIPKENAADATVYIDQLNELNINVVAVNTLLEAIRYLDISLVPNIFIRKRKQVIVVGLMLVALLVTYKLLQPRQQNLTVDFATDKALSIKEPFIVCNAETRFPHFKKLSVSGIKSQASVNDTLGWHIQVNPSIESENAPTDYYLLVAFVGKKTGLSFLPINDQGGTLLKLPVGKTWSRMQQLDNEAEEGSLIFMINEQKIFDVELLRKQFNEQYGNGHYDIGAAQEFLKQRADVIKIYNFETIEQPSVCETSYAKPSP
jgi:hypothetical protein